MCRVIASLPLVLAGYPPINVDLALQQGYYAALRKVFHRHLNEGTCSLCLTRPTTETTVL